MISLKKTESFVFLHNPILLTFIKKLLKNKVYLVFYSFRRKKEKKETSIIITKSLNKLSLSQ